MKRTWLIVLLLLMSAIPPTLYLAAILPADRISVDAARKLLADRGDRIAVVDLRTPVEFANDRFFGSISIPEDTIKINPGAAWPSSLRDKERVLLICNGGVRSAIAAQRLRNAGFENVSSIDGGIDLWEKTSVGGQAKDASLPGRESGMRVEVRRIEFNMFEQVAIVIAAFVVKPLYEIAALIVGIVLWRRREPDLVALRWSMFAFFFGETACAVNFLFFGETSILWEYLHCLGMVAAFGFGSYAVMTFLDNRVLHFSAKTGKCALLPVCRQCWRHSKVACSLRHLFLFTIGCLVFASMMLLVAPMQKIIAVGPVLGGDVVFSHPRLFQALEIRLCPVIALPFLMAVALVLWRQREAGFASAKLLLAIALGPLGFGILRFVIFWSFQERPLWADFWEEMSELGFILGVILTLWVFRRSLLANAPAETAGTPTMPPIMKSEF